MTIGEKLARLSSDVDRTALARSLDVPAGRLAKWITGRTRPGFHAALSIARCFNVDPLWLLDDRRDFPPVQSIAHDRKRHYP